MAISSLKCWCDNSDLIPFSPGYRRCPRCETLVAVQNLQPEKPRVKDDAQDFYGRRYWFSHQEKDLGFPDILARSRSDLSERCLYWLRALLKYKIPPAKVLELGSAHGGFVALLQGTGFEAMGLELSPWVVEYAQKTFGVPMLLGPIEDQSLKGNSLDGIALLDVLEHLSDPLGTLSRCLGLLAQDGVLIIQTPRYPEQKSYEELLASQDRFLEQMKRDEHLFLFSSQSIQAFLKRLGVDFIVWEPPLFPHYDMFFLASRSPLLPHPPETIEGYLGGHPQGRIVQALLDLYGQRENLHRRFLEAEADRAARREVILQADRQLQTCHRQIQDLEKSLLFRLLRKLKIFDLLAFSPGWPFRPGSRRSHDFALSPSPIPGSPATRKREVARIAVDLTPLLPGGENGGAKLLAIEIVRSLRQLLPGCQFLLLTADWNHEVLSFLDAPNTRRLCLTFGGPGQNPSLHPFAKRLNWKHRLLRAAESLPPSFRKRLKNLYISRYHPGSPVPESLRAFRAQVYFCPFTMPYFPEPSVPIVSVLYDLQYLSYPYFFDPADHLARERNFRETCRRADRIVCISEFVRQTVLKNSDLSPDRVTTILIQLGGRLGKIPAEPIQAVLEKYHLREKEFFFYPANYWVHKNHSLLFTAFGMYRFRHPDSPLHLVCSGALGERRSALQRFVQRLGLGSWIQLLGYLPEEEFAPVFSSCRALIFPSLYEGFGMPVVEAMEMGKPVLCSQGTSLPEVAGEAALYFDPRKPDSILQAMEQVTTNGPLVNQLIRQGRRRSQRYTDPTKMAQEYLAVFQEVLK